jgi:hypothetical protein
LNELEKELDTPYYSKQYSNMLEEFYFFPSADGEKFLWRFFVLDYSTGSRSHESQPLKVIMFRHRHRMES